MNHLPLAPLVVKVCRQLGLEAHQRTAARALADWTNTRPETVRRALARYAKSGIPEEAADRYAVAAGCHISEIWDDWDQAQAGQPSPT